MPYGLYVPEVPDDLSEQKAPPKNRMQVVGEESGGMSQGKSYGPLRVDVEQSHSISEMTIAHYDRMAEAYWEGTRDHDVSQNYTALLDAIENHPPIPFLIWVVDPVETSAIFVHWATTL
jgi:hypothetical protein